MPDDPKFFSYSRTGPSFERPPGEPRAVIIKCPNCGRFVPADAEACAKCEFPFVCDPVEIPPEYQKRKKGVRGFWKVLGLLAIVALGLTEAFYFLYRSYSDEYFGITTAVADSIAPLSESDVPWLKIEGDGLFKERTLLTLALMKQRTPTYYDFVADRITEVSEIKTRTRIYVNEHPVHLKSIGAMVDSLSGKMWIKTRMAFGANVADNSDWAVFNYAATLVHEASHVESSRLGLDLDTVAEEVYCEEKAYDFLLRAGAPQVLIEQKEAYLKYPDSPKYRSWYRWYHQFSQGG
ncbi:MAG: hypothetical protein HRF49_05305 [bacterium]